MNFKIISSIIAFSSIYFMKSVIEKGTQKLVYPLTENFLRVYMVAKALNNSIVFAI